MAMAVVACRPPVARAAAVRRGRTSRAPVVASALPLHIEFCQVAAAVEAAHGGKFTVALNDPEQLKRLSPSGTWRRGAFEVVRADTGAVLYSKLGTGQHLVDGMSDKLAGFVARLAAEQ